MDRWNAKPDEERAEWALAPLAGVGPLRFGMRSGEVSAALGIVSPFQTDVVVIARKMFRDVGVTTYYSGSAGLAGVAVDALVGPQVTFDGTPLVGRVPSELEQWFVDQSDARKIDLRVTAYGALALPDLGLVMRVQRAGDVLLTRLLILTHEWAMNPDDYVPESEWHTWHAF
ncbi:hypothetical protein [Frankia nepalensis]|nr:hypothetical protein [Frankia nepalensis]